LHIKKQNIFDLTCEKQYQFSYGDKTYDIYDQVFANSNSRGKRISIISNTTKSYSSELTTKVNIKSEIPYFSLSPQVEAATKILTESEEVNVFSETSETYVLYDVRLRNMINNQNPSKIFQDSINNLPNHYDEESYERFIEHFGTHVIYDSEIGGVGNVKTTVQRKYLTKNGENTLKIQVDADFQYLKMNAVSERHKREGSKEYVENTRVDTEVRGGNPMLLYQWSDWLKTIEKNPIRVTYKVVEISELVKDLNKKKFH